MVLSYSPPEAVPVVKIEERFLFAQAFSCHAGLAHFVGALHALDRGVELSTDDAFLGILRRWVVRVSLIFLPLGLFKGGEKRRQAQPNTIKNDFQNTHSSNLPCSIRLKKLYEVLYNFCVPRSRGRKVQPVDSAPSIEGCALNVSFRCGTSSDVCVNLRIK